MHQTTGYFYNENNTDLVDWNDDGAEVAADGYNGKSSLPTFSEKDVQFFCINS